MKQFNAKETLTEFEVSSTLVEDKCSHPQCKITILVDKDDKTSGRKSLCTSCLMRQKLKNGIMK